MANRIRAQAIFRNAIQRLGAQDETRGLARYLANLNAVLSEEEPAERASRPVPVIEDIDGEEAADSVRAAPMPDEPIAGPGSPHDDADVEDSADDNSTVDQDEPADREQEVADEPVSGRDALKLVRAADRELARAIEQCVGREDLLAELQRARTRIAAGMREIEQTPVEQPMPATTGKRRGRPANGQETARRVALLARLNAGEITNAEAAAELGIKASAWSSWKVLHRKRMAAVEGADRSHERTYARRGRGRPANVQETARRLAMLSRVERGELDHSAAAKELGLTPGVWGLWRARQAKAAGGGKPVAKKATRKSGRSRKADPANPARRVAILKRVQTGELNNAAAARELGIKVGAWGVWKSGYLKRAGKKRGRPPGKATTRASAPTGSLAGVVAQLEGLQGFGRELNDRIREKVELVEERFPG